ncbi:CxC2 domain-containing protein [Favolaschia claudopus]|uniref:CxC2 domain-containing protein n=1 Tax=Favolaschia claudopus TaxID=2862362 RepID=A0AAV9YYS9_9AGAR
MSSHFVSPTRRAPNRSQTVDAYVDYEATADDISRDTDFTSSQDGLRGVRRAVNVQSRRPTRLPHELDALSNWTPLADGERVDEEEVGDVGSKRKRYDSSDEPMKTWRPLAQLFLEELVRRDGLGDFGKACGSCGRAEDGWRRFRCEDCGPNGRVLFGARSPSRPWDMFMDFPTIHDVKYRYCACDLSDRMNNLQQLLRTGWYPASTVDPATCATLKTLESFRLLNVVGDLTVHDFVRVMEQCTDASGLEELPDRRKGFGRMSRQFAFVQRMKRAGRAHDAGGLESTTRGECAVLCWACPQEGINLPEGWEDVGPEFQFLYILIIAMDANFRLRNRLRANAHEDPPLGSGWGHIVEESCYKKHLRNYVAEKDISTCIAFAALAQKDTRLSTGLRASGMGGVVCARHELVRPQGLGDLQKGERYANMDYIVLAALMGVALLYVAIAYDIVCQYRINFEARMAKLPNDMQLDLKRTKVLYGLPVWHATAHERNCQSQNSLTYQPGVGRTDGEGTERVWSVFNGLATATKEMNRGAREDGIEDKVDHHNFQKNIRQGEALPRKLVIAIDERDRQVAAFDEVDRTLDQSLRKEWQGMVDAWTEDKTKPNPYQLDDGKSGVSEASIRQALAQEELDEAVSSKSTLHKASVTSMLVMGLQLEDHQDRIRRESKGRALLAGDLSERVTTLRRSFHVKLKQFRRLQDVYTPGAVEELRAAEERRDSELPPPQAEDIVLYMPSGLTRENREVIKGLGEKEARLREGQLHDTVKRLRSSLHAKRHLLNFREEHWVGQRGGTRAATLIAQLGERIEGVAVRYRRARRALVLLRGEDECGDWRPLEDADIRLDQEQEPDAAARLKLSQVGSRNGKKERRAAAISSKQRKMSWIWTQGGGPGSDEEQLVDAVRVEWAKTKARRDRWVEEVELLREEMRRVLRFLAWRALWWEQRRVVSWEVAPEVRAGLQAYAARQAALVRRVARTWREAWNTSATTAVRTVIANEEMERMGGEELVTTDADIE